MTDSQSNRLDMFIVVRDFYRANQTALDAVAAIKDAFIRVGDNISLINDQVSGQSSVISGVTADKVALRNILNETALFVLAPAKAWALSINNNTLAAEFNFSLSELKKIKDDTMPAFCSHRINIVSDNLAAMADFGLTPAEVTAWQTANDNYASALAAPRLAVNNRNVRTRNLKTLFKETMSILKKQLDPLMVPFKASNPDIYNGYHQARIIIDRRGPSSNDTNPTPAKAKLAGQVLDAVTRAPLSEVSVTLSAATGEAPITVLTDTDGKFHFIDLMPKAYTLSVEKAGYQQQSGNVTLSSGEDKVLNIELVPEP